MLKENELVLYRWGGSRDFFVIRLMDSNSSLPYTVYYNMCPVENYVTLSSAIAEIRRRHEDTGHH